MKIKDNKKEQIEKEYKNTDLTRKMITGTILFWGVSSLIAGSVLTTIILNKEHKRREEISKLKQDKRPAIEKLYKEYYPLKEDKRYKIVETRNVLGNVEKHFVEEYKNKELDAIDKDKYSFLVSSNNDNYSYYIDLLDAEVVSIKTNSKDEQQYLINLIVDETNAYEYAKIYFGDKEEYSYEEIAKMIKDLNINGFTRKRDIK